MTSATGANAANAAGEADARGRSIAHAWRELRAEGEIQFAELELPPAAEPPAWWQSFLEWLGNVVEPLLGGLAAAGRAVGLSGEALTWIIAAAGALLGLYLLWRTLASATRRRAAPAVVPEAWTPDATQALALLEEADRLATEGRYDEAAHLLLRRSVAQIASARPEWLDPSTTAREIAALPALGEAARAAFGAIAEPVERSLFALRSLTVDDWRAARTAYAEFALAAPQPVAA